MQDDIDVFSKSAYFRDSITNNRTKIGHVAFVHTATRVRIQQLSGKNMRKSKATESKMTQMIPCLLT